MRLPRPLALAGLAAAVVLLDALKPLTVDDGGFCYFAAQIARHPLDPFGFDLMGEKPAMQTLAPLLLPYWLAGAMRLLGEQPWLWKLSLLPFALLLAFALHALLRRFARGLELPLTAMLLLSPTFLPAWNLMADLPALALSTAAVAVYLRAVDRSSLAVAALAGLLAGLAALAKYTGFAAPAVFVLHAALYGGWRRALAAAALAALAFAGWEAYVAAVYGESHFLLHLGRHGVPLVRRLRLVLPLLTLLGALAPCLGLLGLAALGASRRALLGAAAFVGLAYLAALVPQPWQILIRSPEDGAPRTTLTALFFGLTGTGVVTVLAAVAWRLVRRGAACRPSFPAGPADRPGDSGGRRDEWFLLLWLGLEAGACVAMALFPAARRLLGIELVLTLLVGRLAARTCLGPGRRGLAYVAVAGSALLGLAYCGLDLWEARVRQSAAERAARWARRQGDGAAWFVGGGGFGFYAERAGLRPVTTRQRPRPGDWLVIDCGHAATHHYTLPAGPPACRLVLADALPLRTHCCYYAGASPVEHHEGPRLVVGVYHLPPARAVARRPAGDYSDRNAPAPTSGPGP
jgi:hypothetical protein